MNWISKFLLKEGPAQTRALFSKILNITKDGVFGNIHSGKCYCSVWLEFPCVHCLSSKQNAPPREPGSIHTLPLDSWRQQKGVCFPYPTTGAQIQLPQSLLIHHVLQTPLVTLVALYWTPVCPCLCCTADPQMRHSTPDAVSQVLNRGNESVPSTCGQHMLK